MLSTLPAIASGLLGALTAHWLRSARTGVQKLRGLWLGGLLALGLGAAWGLVLPLNKYLWTSSFAVYTAGFALIYLGAWYWLVDLRHWLLAWVKPFVWLGVNPLLAYCGSQIGSIALGVLYVGTPEQHTHLSILLPEALFGKNWDVVGQTLWQNPLWPSLVWALLYLTFWTLLTGFCYRKHIFLKI